MHSQCRRLNTLDVRANQLTTLPSEVYALKLTRLLTVDNADVRDECILYRCDALCGV